MTDSVNSSAEVGPSAHRPDSRPEKSSGVWLQLPADLRTAIAQRVGQSGKPAAQVIEEALRQALGLLSPETQTLEALSDRLAKLEALQLEALSARLEQLEALVHRFGSPAPALSDSAAPISTTPIAAAPISTTPPAAPIQAAPINVTAIDQISSESTVRPEFHNPGSSMASLWMQVSQDNRSPASIAASQVGLEQCPRCQHKLGAPLKTSGRQVCAKCGWTDKPRGSVASSPIDPTDPELRRLLDQVAAESQENMKPRVRPSFLAKKPPQQSP